MIEEMLIEYPTISKQILKLNEDLRIAIEAKLNADGCIKASQISDMPHGSEIGDPTYNLTADLFESLEEICIELRDMAETTKYQIQRLIDIKKDIDYAFMYLKSEEKRIIQLRYMDYPAPKYNWRKVLQESNYSDSQCYEIHKIALEKISKVLNIGVKRSRSAL